MSGVLAPLRFDVRQARGRRYPESPHPYRNDFQRDRDRIVHARAFRRLEDKTQVFAPGLSDHFRNRLTHTIEVAQIARTVAGVLGLDEDLTEALALGHDIGHPPFGHAGEAELNRLMQEYGSGFDHNLHALRIVEWFEQHYARFPGLNLTFEVREGIVKHSRDFAPGEIPELETFLPGLRPPLEAQLIDLCDEIAYNTADLDDGYSAGLISLDELSATIPELAVFRERIESQYPGASEQMCMNEIVRALINWMVSGLIKGTVSAAGASGAKSVSDVREAPARLASFSAEVAPANFAMKAFLRRKVYQSELVAGDRESSVDKLAAVFRVLLRQPGLLPGDYLELTAEEPAHRAVCDYVAGMTDGFLLRTWEQLRLEGLLE
ncbi:MAG: deoxyguanosinetriphosphate triphosphohydrolase [Bryobacteraceae bacterium]